MPGKWGFYTLFWQLANPITPTNKLDLNGINTIVMVYF